MRSEKMSTIYYYNPIFDNYSNNYNMNYETESNLYKNSISIAKDASPQSEIYFSEDMEIINQIKNRILEFANILSQIDFFNREFYMIMSVQNMFDYIFKNQDVLDGNLDFLITTTKSFFDVFNFKINNCDKINTNHNIKKEYKKLSRNFLKQQNYFFTEIYESQGDEKFINDMTKVLSR